MTTRSRLARLEAARSPTTETDPRIDRVSRMCNAPILLQLVDDLATDRFMRRLLAEDRYPPGGTRGPGLSGDARRIEVPELERFPVDGDVLAAIEAWAGEPDELGWPRENTGMATGRALFRSRLGWYGKRSDEIRGGTYAAAWRDQYPTWRARMSALGTTRWEMEHLLDMPAADVARMIPEGDGDA